MSDLLEQSVTYEELYSKYSGFIVPTVEIKIEDVKLPTEIAKTIAGVKIELTTVTSQMNVATFAVQNMYNYEKECFDDSIIQQYFKLGNMVEISIGYLVTEAVFKGYIYETQFRLDIEQGISIMVTCKDFKGLLSNKKGDLKRLGSSRVGEVRNILAYPGYSRFATLSAKQLFYLEALQIVELGLKAFGLITEQHDPMTTELEKVESLAKNYMYQFYVFHNQIFFKPMFFKDKEDIMTISPQKGILRANTSYNIGKMLGWVEVRGQDPDNMSSVIGIAKKSIPSNITTNKEALGVNMLYDETITSYTDAFKKAFSMIGSNAYKSSQIEVECIGIPDIVPGRYIKIEGLSANMNKSICISEVTHTIDLSGFKTNFTGKVRVYE